MVCAVAYSLIICSYFLDFYLTDVPFPLKATLCNSFGLFLAKNT